MTVIAWDGKTLAADKRAVQGSLIRTTTKIFRSQRVKALLAYAGEAAGGNEMVFWFESGAVARDFPEKQRDPDKWAGLLVVYRDGTLHRYEHTPHPVVFEDATHALGSGRELALMAMHLGKTAKEAVELACLFDSGCGNGVDTLTFDKE